MRGGSKGVELRTNGSPTSSCSESVMDKSMGEDMTTSRLSSSTMVPIGGGSRCESPGLLTKSDDRCVRDRLNELERLRNDGELSPRASAVEVDDRLRCRLEREGNLSTMRVAKLLNEVSPDLRRFASCSSCPLKYSSKSSRDG